MNIHNLFQDNDPLASIPARILSPTGKACEQNLPLLHEHLLQVYINEKLTMRITCTPEYLPELLLGRLLSEGIIASPDEVESLSICPQGTTARVFLINRAGLGCKDFLETTPSCCTGNRLLDGETLLYRDLRPLLPHPWREADIFSLSKRFQQGTPLHNETRGAHSCFLARGDELLFCCEDLGRHNALDKAIGYALLQGIPLGECTIYTSGRVPLDMVAKTIRAGVPIFVSKAVPTAEGVALAAQYHLTLICCARPDSCLVYNDASKDR